MNARVAREIFAGRSGRAWDEGEPGDAFLCFDERDPDCWVIWKYLDGEALALARELGYPERVVSLILMGDAHNPPHTGKADDDDPPYAMYDPRDGLFDGIEWFYLGAL